MQIYTFIFFGTVGSGKGTQTKLLTDYLKSKDNRESIYISPGHEYRKHIESGTYVGGIIKDSMDRGELQPDFLTNSVVTNILVSSLSPDKHIFADGYPRSKVQSEIFESMLKFFKRDNIKIIYLDISKDEAIKRMKIRGRHDDTDEGIEQRFKEYINNVVPAMDYFKGKKDHQIYDINGEQSIEDVHKDIIKALELS
jgi:adenylate kinase family enzyme